MKFKNGCSCHAEMGAIKLLKSCNRKKTLKKQPVLFSIAFKIDFRIPLIADPNSGTNPIAVATIPNQTINSS